MKKIFLLTISLVLLCSFKTNLFVQNIDKIFVAWNTLTYNSISRQTIEIKKKTKDKYTKEVYESRLKSFKAYVDINNLDDINKNSIRYEFLEKLNKERGLDDDFYIIEANRSGERIEIINFITYPISKTEYQIIRYNYNTNNEDWEKVSFKSVSKIEISCLNKCFSTIGYGKNHDDITITHIVNGVVKSSDFYIKATYSGKFPEYD